MTPPPNDTADLIATYKDGQPSTLLHRDSKRYVAVLNQTGTDAPVPFLLEDTLIAHWTYVDATHFRLIAPGMFPVERTLLPAGVTHIDDDALELTAAAVVNLPIEITVYAVKILEAVTNLVAVAFDDQQIDLTWDLVTSATGYVVEQSMDNNSWSVIGTAPSDNLNSSGLYPDNQYFYRVKAIATGYADSQYIYATATTLP